MLPRDPNRPDDNFMSNDRLLEGRRFEEAGNNDRSTSNRGHLQIVRKKLNNFRFEHQLFKTPIGSPRPQADIQALEMQTFNDRLQKQKRRPVGHRLRE